MNCAKCGSTMWLEVESIELRHYDVVCVSCGRRVMVDTSTDAFGKYLRAEVVEKPYSTYAWVSRPHMQRRTLLLRINRKWRVVREESFSDERQVVLPA